MVHYDASPDRLPVQVTLCPKCGSHRTEVVGKSQDAEVVVIRCNVCGELSEVANPAQGAAAAAPDIASLMKGFVIGGDFRNRVRAGGTRHSPPTRLRQR